MRSIIFANYMAKDTHRLSPTLDVENTTVKFLGNIFLNLWDCGGQYRFYESYFDQRKGTIFRNVEVLIYVFDMESQDTKTDLMLFEGILDAMKDNCPDANIFILIHKMDTVEKERQEQELAERCIPICQKAEERSFKVKCFGTSIWDETLYKAWSSILHSLIPNAGVLASQLTEFSDICGADEVVLFEKETFLVISHASRLPEEYDGHRFERISNIIKAFKLSCSKTHTSQFQGMEVRNSKYTGIIDSFTASTFIMVIQTTSGPKIPATLTQLNIAAAKKHFEKFIEN